MTRNATIELEINLLLDSVDGIADALRRAADNLQGVTTVKKGLGTYLIDAAGNDIGCVAPWVGARDMTLEAA